MEGWVKIHRQLMNWRWWDSDKHLRLFITLLIKANHSETQWRKTTIKPGSLLTGRKQLSKWSGLSERQIRTILRDFEATSEVTIKTTSKFSIITLLNWHMYQDQEKARPGKRPGKRPTSDQQVTTSKNVKEWKEVYGTCGDLLSFLDPEIQTWVSKVTKPTVKRWLSKYGQEVLQSEIEKAYDWDSGLPTSKRKKKIGQFVSNWLEKSRNAQVHLQEKQRSDCLSSLEASFKEINENENEGILLSLRGRE